MTHKKSDGEGFQDTNLGEIQELTDTTQEELTENNLMKISTFIPAPVNEEDLEAAVPENKLTVDSLAGGGF